MQTGIIGLPQVGKTTLFKILTKANVAAQLGARGGARSESHVGIARVPDTRLDKLAELYKPKKTTYATVEYVDVGGALREKGKESAALAQLREVDALAHVVRVFENPSVPHAAGAIDPLRDAENLDLELVLSDLDQVLKRLERLEKDLKKKKDPAQEYELAALSRCKAALEAGQALRELEFSAEESKTLSGFMFLSQRPMLYVINLGDEDAADLEHAVEKHKLEKLTGRPNTAVVPICGRIEAELAELGDEESAELLSAYGLKSPGLDRVIQASYALLGLIAFFTAGEPEARAWTIRRGTNAQKAAGAIHSDIERGFIKAEVVRWDQLLEAGGWPGARERGWLRLEGKEYVMQEGDVVLFRHSG
ncbi:MAG TPA: redox-regulated ATPase YchF [Candidatus Acidoferrales bacterium]|nr:redox-regulated ATPase YchF [Candidatus Acidoferrales bacterium]